MIHARTVRAFEFTLLLGIGSLYLSLPLYGQDDSNRDLPPAPYPESPSSTRTFIPRAPSTVSVLSGDDLNTLGVRSIADAFRIIPGMEVQKISATESSVSIRSYTGPSAASQGIQGVLDGRQVYNDFFGGVFWENIPVTMDEIKSIEVIRGPGSFLYGPNAMHGVIVIATKSPLDYAGSDGSSHDVYISASGGSYGANTESLTVVHCEGDSGIKVTLAHDDINQFEGNTDTRNKIFVDARFETRFGAGQTLEITAGASRQQFDVMFPELFISPGISALSATYTTIANEYFAKLNYRVADHLKIQVSETHFTSNATPDNVYEPFSVVIDTIDLDAQYSFSILDGHLVTVGTGYRYATFITDDFDVANGRHATNLAGVFVQDEFALWRNFFVTAGARADIHSTAGVSISPRGAVVWQFVPEKRDEGGRVIESGQSVRVTAGTGFQNPSLREIWFNMPINPAGSPVPLPAPPGTPTVAGNRDLKPQEMRSFEIGYWGRPVERLQVESSVYYNLIDGLAQFEPGSNNTIARHNVGHEDAYGIETSVEYQLTKEVYVFGNYAYEIRQNRDTGDRIPSGPKNKANAGVRVVNRESLSGMLWVNFFDEVTFLDPNNTTQPAPTVPAYTLVNAKIWYPVTLGRVDGKVFAQGFNLLDNVHKEHPNGDAYGLIAMAGVELAW